MRYLLLVTFLYSSFLVFSQQISTEQQIVLTQFDLNPQDHRGVEFQLASASNPGEYTTLQSAIEGFFATAIKKDYTIITINSGDPQYLNTPLNILQLVDIYINLSNN